MSKSKRPRGTEAGEILARITGDDPEAHARIAAERIRLCVAESILAAREAAGLTQQALAERVGTTQSVISRLEDADYEGHTLSMLQRIAGALGRRVEVHLVAERKARTPRAVVHARRRRG